MDLSGMIFVALAIVWAVYLIPKAIARSDDEIASHPAAEPESAPEHDATPSRWSRLTARRRARTARRTSAPVVSTVVDPAVRRRPLTSRERAAMAVAVRRRRRVLAVLAVGVLVSVGLVLGGLLLPWTPIAPAALLVGWLVVCRRQVARLDAARAQRLVVAEAAAEAAAEAEQAEVLRVEQIAREVLAAATAPAAESTALAAPLSLSPTVLTHATLPAPGAPLVIEPDEDTAGLDAAAIAAALGDEMPRAGTWDPRPLYVPMYVTKPRARRSVRGLAAGDAGVASSARDAADSALVARSRRQTDAAEHTRQAVGS